MRKEVAQTGLRYTVKERKPRCWRRDVSNSNEPGNRDTKYWHQQPNNLIEAYTVNDIDHREDRNS
jgi:hypothetical protein